MKRSIITALITAAAAIGAGVLVIFGTIVTIAWLSRYERRIREELPLRSPAETDAMWRERVRQSLAELRAERDERARRQPPVSPPA